ncbi:hypothetical protein J2Z65_006857 [Paenibacillus aceris]|uniref:Uncharacterized protein n=1 Tax=Paenibacillus aceris TaxID=869555 RepID=A0ABS4I9H7_9BACL|nr:hypothetical protein [Paenibacillus aceris]
MDFIRYSLFFVLARLCNEGSIFTPIRVQLNRLAYRIHPIALSTHDRSEQHAEFHCF